MGERGPSHCLITSCHSVPSPPHPPSFPATHPLPPLCTPHQPPDPGSYDAALAGGAPTAVLQLYGAVDEAEGGDAMATASDERALQAVLDAAQAPGRSLCAQPLGLSAAGAQA